jgi:hypothetical protein
MCFGFQKHTKNTHASSINVGYKIQYCLPNNTTFIMIIDKFDPNPILVNINKIKPYEFQDIIVSKRLESTIEKGRDITNIEIVFHIATLENA